MSRQMHRVTSEHRDLPYTSLEAARTRSESSVLAAAEIADPELPEDEGMMSAMELEQGNLLSMKSQQFQPWLFGHPRGLYVLAGTEVWERFGFYGMRSLLILYMTQDLFLPENRDSVWGLTSLAGNSLSDDPVAGPQILASKVYGMYTCFAYLTPMAGGFLADQYLGRRQTVMLGASLMSAGYLLLGLLPAAFLPALCLIALGSGALKPNVSSQIGAMYEPWDSRKTSAFLIFYCSINLGAFLSPLVSGVLHATMGFSAGFLASSVAVLAGLIQYTLGLKYIPMDRHEDLDSKSKCSLSDDGKEQEESRLRRSFLSRLYAHRLRLSAILCVCFLTVGFWGVYEQQGNTLPIFVDQDVQMTIGSLRIPTEFAQSINPLLIILFTPLLSAFWRWQAKSDREPGSLTKMCIGCFILSLCYTWLTIVVDTTSPSDKVRSLQATRMSPSSLPSLSLRVIL